MKRRRLLSALAAGSAGLAGCSALGDSGDAPTATPLPVPEDERTPPTTRKETPVDPPDATFEPPRLVEDKTVASVTVGSPGDRPEGVEAIGMFLWNDVDWERSVTVQVQWGDAAPVERTVTVPTDHIVDLRLEEPRDYVVEVDIGGRVNAVSVEQERFDCNSKTIWVRLPEQGHETMSVSTALACGDFDVKAPTPTPEN